MPRVHTLTARKDYPDEGIKKGDTYYKWSKRPGGRGKGIIFRSKTRPTPQQLTSSDFDRTIFDIEDAISGWSATLPDDADPDAPPDEETKEAIVSDFETFRDDIAQQIRDLGEECAGKKENMPEGLQSGPTGELLGERAENCEAWADSIEGIECPDPAEDESLTDWADRVASETAEEMTSAKPF